MLFTAVNQVVSSLEDIQSLNDLESIDVSTLQALFADKQLHWLLQLYDEISNRCLGMLPPPASDAVQRVKEVG